MSTGTGAKPARTSLELLALALAPLAEVAAADLVREDPVDDHRVGQVAVEVEVGEGALRLAITIRSGFITSRIEACSRSRRISFIAIRLRDQPLDLGEHVLARQLDVDHPRDRPRGADQPALPREHLLQPPVGDVGERRAAAASRRSGAQSTITASNSPEPWWRLICSRLKSSSMPGGTVSSSAAMSITPRSASSRAEPALDRAPVGLHLALRLDLLAPEPLADRGRVGPERRPRASRRGCAPDRSRATTVRSPAAAQRRAVAAATLVLPTPPLPV